MYFVNFHQICQVYTKYSHCFESFKKILTADSCYSGKKILGDNIVVPVLSGQYYPTRGVVLLVCDLKVRTMCQESNKPNVRFLACLEKSAQNQYLFFVN